MPNLESAARILASLLAAALLSSPATFVLGVSSVAQAQIDEAGEKEYWQSRYRQLRDRVADLELRYEAARARYTRLKTKNRLIGDARVELPAEMSKLDAELEDARRELAEFPDEARRQGALPGWFREVDDESES